MFLTKYPDAKITHEQSIHPMRLHITRFRPACPRFLRLPLQWCLAEVGASIERLLEDEMFRTLSPLSRRCLFAFGAAILLAALERRQPSSASSRGSRKVDAR